MCMCDFSAVFFSLIFTIHVRRFQFRIKKKKIGTPNAKAREKKVEKLFFSLFILFEVLPTKSLGAFQSRNPRFQNVAFLLGLSKLNDTSPCFANLPPSTSFHSRWTEFLLILAFSFIFFVVFISFVAFNSSKQSQTEWILYWLESFHSVFLYTLALHLVFLSVCMHFVCALLQLWKASIK